MALLEKIIFKQVSETKVDIYCVTESKEEIKIGHIFSNDKDTKLDSYSGPCSIQICGFDRIEGPWSCGIFNHSLDLCAIWNSLDSFLKEKVKHKQT